MHLAFVLVISIAAAVFAAPPVAAGSPEPRVFQPRDIFDLEYATDVQVSPDGRRVAYVRRSFDIMADKARSNIWVIDVTSGEQRPLLTGTASYSSPRWSPDGRRLAYLSAVDGGAQIYVRWLDTGATARITDVEDGPAGLSWSPDGRQIAFTKFVKRDAEPFVKLPSPPEGATWAPPAKVIDRMTYRGDGAGYFEQGSTHVFVVPADGGTPRQVTQGAFDNNGIPQWSADGRTIFIAGDRHPDADRRANRSAIHAVDVATGTARALTDVEGNAFGARVSPDGRHIAFIAATDDLKAYQPGEVWVMDVDGGNRRRLAAALDREPNSIAWRSNQAVVFSYDDEGVTRLAEASLSGGWRNLAAGLGGEDLGRPYSGDSLSAASGRVAFNVTAPRAPADVAVLDGNRVRRLTRLNDDIDLAGRLSDAEEQWVTAPDGTRSQGWILKPPGFDPAKKYPLILEIHGGPHTNYGPRFTSELQLMAAAGYVVLFTNPRGSTSYGEAFGNMIDKAYPGGDYDDLMAHVDAAIAKGYVDPAQLFVTGGSGGGVLTAWIVGNTDRFRAAVVAKPVINWTSFVLYADSPAFFGRYWFGKSPWEAGAQADYWRRSPLSLVGNVKTPTMLLTGEADYRTPISESEQYYAALKLSGVDAVMVRLPEASHTIVDRPSRLISKVAHILAWFERYRPAAAGNASQVAATTP
jgi:acylaminoacyl-peptidase